MLNKIRKEPETFASKIDHPAAENDQEFLQSFDFKAGTGTRKVAGKKGFPGVALS
jgi:hypothetical protein